MSFLIILLILGFLVLILFYSIQFILHYITTVLFNKTFETEKGQHLFSYKSLKLQTNSSNAYAKNVRFGIDLRGLLSPHYNFFRLHIESIEIQSYKDAKSLFDSPPHTVRENIGIQVCVHILAIFVKRIHIDLKKFTYSKPDYSVTLNDLSLKYSKNYSYSFKLHISNTQINFINHLSIDLNPITFSPHFGVDPFLSLINFEALLLPFEFQLSTLIFFVHDYEIKLNPISISFALPRGNITLVTPEIQGKIDIQVPDFTFKINDVSGFLSRQMYSIPHLILNVSILSIKELEISHEKKPVLYINNFNFSQKEDEPKNISYQSAEIFYHTKMMTKLLPFYHDHIFHNLVQVSNTGHKEPYITNSNFVGDKLTFNAKITDTTSIKANITNLKIKNHEVKFPQFSAFVNDQKIVSVKEIKIFINKDKYFQAKAKSFHLHDRSGMFLEDAITEIKLSCHMVAPYLFTFTPNEESLKFPFILTFDQFKIKFHDTELNRSIVHASHLIPVINRQSLIRQFLLNKKKNEMKLNKDAIKEAEFRLFKLAFRDYKDRFTKSSKHRYSFHFVIEKCSFSFDSRNFTDKVKMIHQFDPTTKVLYSELDWDFMLGFNFEFKASTFKVFAFDIKEPIIDVFSMILRGPTIITCPASNDLAKGQFVIDKEVIPLLLNPSSMVLFTDMLIAADRCHFYYGYAFQSIYQEMTIRLYGLLPKSIDPSPRFAWFDLLRACFRGQYIFKSDSFEWRLPSSSDFREVDDYFLFHVQKFHLLCKEGEFQFNAEMLRTPRTHNGKEGPSIVEIPKVTATVRMHWGSEKTRTNAKKVVEKSDGKEISFEKVESSENQRNFIVFPKVSQFNVDGYDTYKDFRARKIFIDDMMIFFSKAETVAPTITVDIAHFNWLMQPITFMIMKRHSKSQIVKKLGFRELQRPPNAKYFIELKAAGHVKAIGDTFVIRVFDHFPINGSVQGSSVDFTFHSFTAVSDFGGFMHEYLANAAFKCSSVSLNATDLSYYTYGGLQTRSPTILVMKPFSLEYAEEVTIKVNELLIHVNQVLLKYIIDFLTSVNVKWSFFQERRAVKKATKSDFPICKASIAIGRGKVHLTSLESDLQIVLVLEAILSKFLADSDDQKAYNFQSQSITMFLEGKFKKCKKNHKKRHKHDTDVDDTSSTENENDTNNNNNYYNNNNNNNYNYYNSDNYNDSYSYINSGSGSGGGCDVSDNENGAGENVMNPFLVVSNSDIFICQSNFLNSFGNLSVSAKTSDVSFIKYMWAEFWTNRDQSARTAVKGSITEIEMSTTFPHVTITLTIGSDVAEINFDELTAVMKKTCKKTNELMLMIMNATVKNLSKDAPFPDALLKWTEQSVTKANRPHIQILLKIPPKIKYAYIFTQAEVNMEPSIVNYDAKFWEAFLAFVNTRYEKKPPKSKKQFIISNGYGGTSLPFVVYDRSVFPSDSFSESEEYSTNKTIRVKKTEYDEHIILMFRYLRINPISMNVTYRNSDNKFLSEINNFQGQMHEIIYHDLTTTVSNLISKIMYDVAKDILPQFLKHVVGFKKQGATPEREMEEWLRSDDKRMSKEDKQKMLLFGSRTLKKK